MKNLTQLSFGVILLGAKIKLPEKLPEGIKISYQEIQDPELKAKIDSLGSSQ